MFAIFICLIIIPIILAIAWCITWAILDCIVYVLMCLLFKFGVYFRVGTTFFWGLNFFATILGSIWYGFFYWDGSIIEQGLVAVFVCFCGIVSLIQSAGAWVMSEQYMVIKRIV